MFFFPYIKRAEKVRKAKKTGNQRKEKTKAMEKISVRYRNVTNSLNGLMSSTLSSTLTTDISPAEGASRTRQCHLRSCLSFFFRSTAFGVKDLVSSRLACDQLRSYKTMDIDRNRTQPLIINDNN